MAQLGTLYSFHQVTPLVYMLNILPPQYFVKCPPLTPTTTLTKQQLQLYHDYNYTSYIDTGTVQYIKVNNYTKNIQ
jgi:hypothetical protein